MNLKKSLLILFVGLLVTEFGLRAIGAIVLQKENPVIDEAGVEENTGLRILTIGESTTFGLGANNSWPSLLEVELKRIGVKARVFNVARPSTTTSFLLKRLPGQIERFKPHIVISMMGINDNNTFWLREIQPNSLLTLLMSLRIVKSLAWILDVATNKRMFVFEDDADRLLESDLGLAKTKGFIQKIKKDGFSVHKQQISQALQSFSSDEKAQYYAYLSVKLLPGWGEDFQKSPPSLELLRETIKYSIFGSHLLELYVSVLNAIEEKSECYIIAQKVFQSEMVPTDVLLSRLASCSENSTQQIFWTSFFAKYGFQIRKSNQLGQTGINYNHLTRLLRSKRIKHIAMQYPTVPLDNLREFFVKDNSPDLLVGNTKNFQRALMHHGSRALFSDLFAGSFGHTTKLGNSIIVENLIPHVLEVSRRKNTHH